MDGNRILGGKRMKYYKQGFHLNHIEGSTEITDEYWQELLEGQSQGKQIVSDEQGYPILMDYVPSQEELDAQEIDRLKAYLAETDYIYPKCLELGLDVNTEYAEIVQKRKDARQKIQDFDK